MVVLLETVFSVGPSPRLYNEDSRPVELIVRQSAGRVKENREGKPSDWVYNRATLFLGDINTRIWSSRLRESQI
jgi:hypothetical protein